MEEILSAESRFVKEKGGKGSRFGTMGVAQGLETEGDGFLGADLERISHQQHSAGGAKESRL